MFFSLKMAWAYFRKVWSRGIWGVMVVISVMGVMLGVASLVVSLSVMNGFHTEITSRLLSLNPHLILMHPFENENTRIEAADKLEKIDFVEQYSAFLHGKGLLQRRGESHGIVVRGVEPEGSYLDIDSQVWKDLGDEGIIVGSELKNILALREGDEVYLVIPTLDRPGIPSIPRVERFTLAEVFTSGIYEYDSSVAFIDYSRAAAIFEDSAASGIEVYIKDPFKSEQAKEVLEDRLGRYHISTWMERNYNLFAALRLEKTMMFIVLVMIIIVATFNIAGTLIMTSITRSKDCGVMRAVGATKRQIRTMFNFKGLMIGFTGTILGMLLGLGVAFLLSRYEFIQLPPQVYLISTLPVRVSIKDMGVIFMAAMLISLLATLYPSRRASNIEIAREIRYE